MPCNCKLSGTLTQVGALNGTLTNDQTVGGSLSMEAIPVFNKDYNALWEETLPQINSVTLKGNKVSSELHVQHEMDVISYQDIDNILFG